MTVELRGIQGMPEIRPGDDLGSMIVERAGSLESGDVVVVAQKVVSKAEGRLRNLADVVPGGRARALADRLGADARMVQVVLDESARVVRDDRVLIVETHQGFVCANAGVDRSNVDGEDTVSLLPIDCDASARLLQEQIVSLSGTQVGVVVSDTFGRAWRMGLVNVALGVAGIPAMIDYRGRPDDFGMPLQATLVAIADELAAAAELLMGKTRRVPVVVVHGLEAFEDAPGTGQELVRPSELDLFRLRVALLSGGTGGAKLATGLAHVLAPEKLSIVANTADDDEFWGLLVSPDVDAILYRLSGLFNETTGFGVRDDTFHAQDMLGRLGEQTWFRLGDGDIGVHLYRAMLLRSGRRLSEAVAQLARNLGIDVAVIPMSDDSVRTRVRTDAGELSMQQWFVGERCQPAVRGLRFAGVESARPSPEAKAAIAGAHAVIIGPSNPLLSVDPILAVVGAGLERERVTVVSPVVGGRSLKGPTVDMLRQMGEEPTALGVARHYAGVAATIVIDRADAELLKPIRELGMNALIDDTVMEDAEGERRLAAVLLRALESADGS